MALADHIQSAPPSELQELASFLIREFDMKISDATTEDQKPAEPDSVVSALAAWAYMQLNAKDQGD